MKNSRSDPLDLEKSHLKYLGAIFPMPFHIKVSLYSQRPWDHAKHRYNHANVCPDVVKVAMQQDEILAYLPAKSGNM